MLRPDNLDTYLRRVKPKAGVLIENDRSATREVKITRLSSPSYSFWFLTTIVVDIPLVSGSAYVWLTYHICRKEPLDELFSSDDVSYVKK